MPENRVWITDVCPRDGFQIEPEFVSTEIKVKVIDALSAAGSAAIEVTSFVHPKAVPQMADAEEVMLNIKRNPGTSYEVLIPNLRGAERALRTNPNQLNLVVSASESHNRSNLRRGTFDTLNDFVEVPKLASSAGVLVQGGVATAFGCPFEGEVPVSRVLDVIHRYLEMGVDTIKLADTTGMANPEQVRNMIREVKNRWPELRIHLHFHNTRGMGLANVYAAYLEGVRHFDASLGGIGGCPFAPGASGNICTEDTVNMFHDMKIVTGVDLDQLLAASGRLEKQLGHSVPSQVLKAGKTLDLHSQPQF
ncbi:hydroxymethylglutaryl-CoA lyase [Ammoniphilus sp. YIM 78166]|uniref:hydroxymethylglutaryl-CoA lyase n=1 Tax=Ammoniphilus sp. YIM 78166 TaxID=1644106 RepID=UPI00106F181D|nr:hydroxymethylglutaryl-CoA lyase [Ammoniphilus sp. YIM 78166]